MSAFIEDIENEDNATETTRLVPDEPTMHADNVSTSKKFVPVKSRVARHSRQLFLVGTKNCMLRLGSIVFDSSFLKKYKDYNNLIYLSVLTILLCFPLGLAALVVALKAHEDAKSGHIVRAKKKATVTYLIIAAAVVIDVIIIVSVVSATI